ncbi:MAG: hypothetical protein ABIS12_17990 [Bacteroidia bacterium]
MSKAKRMKMTLRLSRKTSRAVAVTLVTIMLSNILFPVTAWALTGGPSQPEVQSFEPIGTSEMVDINSGDFNYNLPLLDMDGYPVNLAYHSGITMDQEASWVGLGWNINPGVINRSMRGIPDDFNGDAVVHDFNMKTNKTIGFNGGFGAELFGYENAGINFSIGVSFNNYNGVGIEKSLNLSLSAGGKGAGKFTGGLGLTSSSDNGLTIQPSLNFELTKAKAEKNGGEYTGSLGLTVGTSFNGRSGLKQLSITTDVSAGFRQQQGTTDGGNPIYVSTGSSLFGTSSSFSFGAATYTPKIDMPMQNFSLTGRFKFGGELFGIHGSYTVGGYFSSQKLMTTSESTAAYGYMHYDEGQKYGNSMLDFNRENDGSFTVNTPALPLTSLTYDIYSVSGQGVGGSYRPFRSDVGYVYDAYNYSTSDGYSIGGELGSGNLFHAGVDFSVNNTNTSSGSWNHGNDANSKLIYHPSASGSSYEPFYFKEANEKSVDSDPGLLAAYGGSQAERFELNHVSKFNTHLSPTLVNKNGGTTALPTSNKRSQREKRGQVIYQLTRKEVNDGFGLNGPYPGSYSAPDHHIAEITTYGTDGMRYVYGLPAYNKEQNEVTFAVGNDIHSSGARTGDCVSGLIDYETDASNNQGVDNSFTNERGLDNYYSKVKTPAFAHSYLLTAVLSSDYIDADVVKGPSTNDLGNYTQFFYSKIDNYKWRVPVQQDTATWNEGLRADLTDDKANYIYGNKELWYLDSIVSKNYIAIFIKEARKDGCGVLGENGGMNTDPSKSMKLLRKISLYVLRDYHLNGVNAVPIKEVHFEYDYSLCPDVPNNTGASETVSSVNLNAAKGKLTLKKVYFTYQNSNKARLSPYQFSYSINNPSYNLKGYDRWGNYKPNGTSCGTFSPLNSSEYPYVVQNQSLADTYTSSWSLVRIDLPSGGKINVEYESDDYAYVQNKQAMQMFKIIGVENNSGLMSTSSSPVDKSISDATNKNRRLYFELQPGYTNINDYFVGINKLYFRCFMSFDSIADKHDYVSGYAEIAQYGDTVVSGQTIGWVRLNPVKLKDNGNADYNPIAKTAIQFGRMNLSRFIWNQPGLTGDEGLDEQILSSLINSSFVKNIGDAISGPNKAIWNNNKGNSLVINKSWFRLNNPNHKKLGGGSRVKKISMSDEFSTLTGSQMSTFQYGQEYDYRLEDGTSSGVASYEPQLGGDENPWKQPITFSTENLFAPDDEHYKEEPLGESFFPSPSVGYSRVTVKNLQYSNVNRNATGRVVHEFYTSKDFPTIVDRTPMEHVEDKTDPFSITSILYTESRNHMTATQGFSIELNDMSGKPKKEMVFQEGQTTPITSVEYIYESLPYGNGSFRLDNTATVIDKIGNVSNAQIGVFYDVSADMRQQLTDVSGSSAQINLDIFVFPLLPAPIPVLLIWPSSSHEETQFRSATMTKVIQRFGILKEVIAKDLGSVVSTQNLAYDAETGQLLLTSATTDYNDIVYSMTYPAHWYYDGMGMAYKNIGFYVNGATFDANGIASITGASNNFVAGDELETGLGYKAWVTNVTQNSITAVNKYGYVITGTTNIKVIRSGRRNLFATPISSIATRSNPLNHFRQNIFDNVLQASSAEFSNQWRTFCDCFDEHDSRLPNSTNPYVLGLLGNWRMKRSLLFLSPRSQSNYDNNTNIRQDGVFTSYTPFYMIQNNIWKSDDRNWTHTSEVTEFSPYGSELENRDALGRYSAATFGYSQTLPTAVAANSRYREIGSDNFEDYGFSSCADKHFKFIDTSNAVVADASHTGRYSIKVSSGSPITMNKNLSVCDPAGCTLGTDTTSSVDQFTVSITGGTAPYQIEWNVLSGDPNVTFGPSSINITGNSCVIEIIIVDALGCKTSRIISVSNLAR